MTNIITGAIDSGKTTRLIAKFRHLSGGGEKTAGFVSVKNLNGYDLVDLMTPYEPATPFIRKKPLPDGWEEALEFYCFSFSREGLERARTILEKAANDNASAFFIDEIGMLEIEGRGFDTILRRALASFQNVWLTCREDWLDRTIEKYGLQDATVFSTASSCSSEKLLRR